MDLLISLYTIFLTAIVFFMFFVACVPELVEIKNPVKWGHAVAFVVIFYGSIMILSFLAPIILR